MRYKTFPLKFIYSIMRRKVRSININVTDRCNSRCRTCYIWKKNPNTDLPVSVIEDLLNDRMVHKKMLFGLTGGEFLLHPNYREMLELFRGYEYLFFSNGIMADRLIEAVKRYDIKNLLISADGVDESYKRIRGVDTFSNIRKVVSELRDVTSITIDFTISPFNTKKDLMDVLGFCESNGLKLAVGVYNQPDFIETRERPQKAFEFGDVKSRCFYFHPKANSRFVKYYNRWLEGDLDLECYNIRGQLSILPSGEVSLCQGKNVILGDLNKTSLSDIWNSKRTIEIQKLNRHCNECFLSCQRPIDIAVGMTPLKWFVK
jgi:MoaA/NifB/PqqE/SkfB family radical SAM enzyme